MLHGAHKPKTGEGRTCHETMKALTLSQAKSMGFKTYRCGNREYLPVKLPREIAFSGPEIISNQFERQTENESENFAQAVEDTHGQIGLIGTVYICAGYYSRENGIETWEYYGAIAVAASR